MKRNLRLIIALVLALSMLLVACGPKTEAPAETPAEEKVEEKAEEATEEKAEKAEEEAEEPKEEDSTEEAADVDGYALPHPQFVEKDGDTVEGATLNVGLVMDSPFSGVFQTNLYENNFDYQLMGPMLAAFAKTGDDIEISDSDYAKWEFDSDAKTVTIKIADELTWSDGTPVTSDDIEWQYLLVGHPEYTGVRYNNEFMNVVGMEEYHDMNPEDINFEEEREEPYISGVRKLDEKTIEIEFKEFTPGILWGAGLFYQPEAAHAQKVIPVAELETADVVRKAPLSYGPFVINNVVEGESVEYVRNEHWMGEKPKVEKIIYQRAPSATLVEALKSGSYDLVQSVNVDAYEDYLNLNNVELLSTMEAAYTYIGFKLGKWNADTGQVEMDPNAKMADVELRRAMAHAMDNQQVATAFYNDLRFPANTLITPYHSNFHDETLQGLEHDPEKAKEILDAAGYLDVDGDGFREDKEGNPLVINFASMAGGEIAEPLATLYMQNWNDIGLNVQLTAGRLIEFNAFYDMIKEDAEDVDVYQAAWGTGSNPDPVGLYGRSAQFNYPRFASDANDEVLAKISSKEALDAMIAGDKSVLYSAYNEWQKLMQDEVPVAPTLYRLNLTIINNRVSNWDIRPVSDFGWEKVGLLSDTPEVSQ